MHHNGNMFQGLYKALFSLILRKNFPFGQQELETNGVAGIPLSLDTPRQGRLPPGGAEESWQGEELGHPECRSGNEPLAAA